MPARAMQESMSGAKRFKSSYFLLRQTHCLAKVRETFPDADYYFMDVGGKPRLCFCIESPSQKCQFRLHQGQAMKTGDPASVRFMYELLQVYARRYYFSDRLLKAQLCSEYNVTPLSLKYCAPTIRYVSDAAAC